MTDSDDTIHVGFVYEVPRVGGMVTTASERGDDRNPVRIAANADGGWGTLTTQDIDCIVSGDDTSDRNGIEFLTSGGWHPALPFVLFPGKRREGIIP